MKLTVNLDETLLGKAVKVSGASTRTEAITIALRELTRRAELIEILREGTGLSSDELKDSFDSDSASEFLRSRNLNDGYQIASQSSSSSGAS